MFYLISIRILAHKILMFSCRPAMYVNYMGDKWPLYYRSFNIVIIKNIYPKEQADKIKDAIDLLIRNGHAKKFPHNSVEEFQHLHEDYRDFYLRYITTDEGVFAEKSKFYRDDWIFNVLLSKFSVLQTALAGIIIWAFTSIGSLIWSKEKEPPQPQKTIIILQQKDTLQKSLKTDTVEASKNDTTTFLISPPN
jgi:hypothetical protein